MVVQTKRFAMEGRANIVESTCGICKLGFVDPKILPCIHTFCKKCLVDNVRSAQRQSVPFSCPHCKTPHSLNKDKINALQDNYFVSTLKPDPALRKPKQDVKRNHLRLAAKRRPVSSASRIDVSIGSMKKVRCLKHPSGSVYCKTCEVFQCLMCRNNKEHRGHVLIEATDINEQFDSDDEQLSESNDIFFSVLQQQHLSGQTEEICQRAMHSLPSHYNRIPEDLNQQTEGENEELPNHSENDDDDEVQQVTTSIPKENFKPQPAHRKLERLYPPKPVEHRPLPPIPARGGLYLAVQWKQ
ncbi:putative tripartite motif-containing protein 3-like [Apostichopus japonicus]|uniref:Putative tripartite motif-containing protein 3-like n=1 Tax=Stichopus japonicus TaxID=307972 RepID=A0A2G8JHR5_STIJA|nr:putative tripartite motif-containing protein 3-like [Apostichopus japonicus]